MKYLQKNLGSVVLSGLLLVGCGVQEDEQVLGQTTHEMEPAPMCTLWVSAGVTGAWPKTATWTSDHASCGGHYWNVSWSPSLQYTTANIVTRTPSSEACGIWAGVAYDSIGHTSCNAPSTNVIDDRSISMPSSYTVPVGSGPYLSVPAPHATRHCGNTGSFIFQVYNSSLGVWYDISQSQNVSPWHPTSPTTGYEIYRVKCIYPGVATHYSNNITVTWQNIWCGDGICNGSENASTCPQDCAWCGDGICNGSENASTCPQDCASCGDGICNGTEDSCTCPQDCCGAVPQEKSGELTSVACPVRVPICY